MMYAKNYLEKLPMDQLLDLARFIVSENFKQHTNCANTMSYKDEVEYIFKEELDYFENAQIYVLKDYDKSITGSIRVLRWNYLDVLPIQKIFNINPIALSDGSHQKSIWHIGRFAIRKDIRDKSLFKQLIVCAISPICMDENAVGYAECDSKLLRILHTLGIKVESIGKPVCYLGSETIPVKMSYEGLIDFYCKNKD